MRFEPRRERHQQSQDTHVFELQQDLSGQLDPLLVDVLDGHQVPLRAAPEANTVNPHAPLQFSVLQNSF